MKSKIRNTKWDEQGTSRIKIFKREMQTKRQNQFSILVLKKKSEYFVIVLLSVFCFCWLFISIFKEIYWDHGGAFVLPQSIIIIWNSLFKMLIFGARMKKKLKAFDFWLAHWMHNFYEYPILFTIKSLNFLTMEKLWWKWFPNYYVFDCDCWLLSIRNSNWNFIGFWIDFPIRSGF